MLSDIEISHKTKLQDINLIAKKLGIGNEYIINYGKYMAKIDTKILNEKNSSCGKLILVTSTNPTPFGEGKTTMSIGLNDALCKIGKKSVVVLREPSLGPVFGIKGGATGGGYAQVVPMENINLHFTGDMHAITTCNNLMCAALDNYIFQGNEIGIDPNNILITRAMDMNDRALRHIKLDNRDDSFVITVASEIMAILCLCQNLNDLKEKLGNILIGYTYDNKPVFVKDLGLQGSMAALLKDAIYPNLVQTLENNPAIIHGGPFANIAHGCNSLIATRMGLQLADYVVTEAGFGADLGAEKFLDIKCRVGNLKPDCIVVNTTVRSVKYNGGCPKESLNNPDVSFLEHGIENLKVHILNMNKFTKNIVVCINKFYTDSDEELQYVSHAVEEMGFKCSISDAHANGAIGSIELAKIVVDVCNNQSDFKFLYNTDLSIKEKIAIISQEIYRANLVQYSEKALESIEKIEKLGFSDLPVCIAKTQYSLSDDPKKIGCVGGYDVTVRDVKLNSGANFIVVLMGNIMTMPGLSKKPALLNIDITSDGKISGLF